MTRRERGMTMVEIMVAVLLVGIAAAFTFGIQVRASSAFRDQATVAELQQTLRAVSDLLVRDLRATGYRAKMVRTANGVPTTDIYAIEVQNGAGGYGSDVLRLQFADDSKLARSTQNAVTNKDQTEVDALGGFVAGDLALASTRTVGPKFAHGCILSITGTNPGPPAFLIHSGAVAPWNAANNPQCDDIWALWNDGYTTFTTVVLRTYRVRPADQRGVLEMSPSGGIVANDWVPLAVGVLDLQVAIRVYQPADVNDEDGDGDPERDWFSGDNMNTARTLVVDSEILQVSATVVAKSSKEVGGPTVNQTPDLFEPAKPLDNNSIGDRAGTALPVAATNSPYFGNFVYRMYTCTVDLRNVGVGL